MFIITTGTRRNCYHHYLAASHPPVAALPSPTLPELELLCASGTPMAPHRRVMRRLGLRSHAVDSVRCRCEVVIFRDKKRLGKPCKLQEPCAAPQSTLSNSKNGRSSPAFHQASTTPSGGKASGLSRHSVAHSDTMAVPVMPEVSRAGKHKIPAAGAEIPNPPTRRNVCSPGAPADCSISGWW